MLILRPRTLAQVALVLALSVALLGCNSTTPSAALSSVMPSATAASLATPSASAYPTPTDSPVTPKPTQVGHPRPSIDPAQLAALLTASITLINLGDSNLAITVSIIDPTVSPPQTYQLGTYLLNSSEQVTESVPATTYQIVFHQPADAVVKSTCHLTVKDGDKVTFVAVPGGVAVSEPSFIPKTVGDLFVSTSSLCRS